MTATPRQLFAMLRWLRSDALELGMFDLALAYGMAAIRAGNEAILEVEGFKPWTEET